mmetsp:Transcript_9838/g.25321  ORF Transcript_9838/g.25321 Transcript_9838/m.25321 type:complete len:204 (+) Transcript_9838:1119-1730(+)
MRSRSRRGRRAPRSALPFLSTARRCLRQGVCPCSSAAGAGAGAGISGLAAAGWVPTAMGLGSGSRPGHVPPRPTFWAPVPMRSPAAICGGRVRPEESHRMGRGRAPRWPPLPAASWSSASLPPRARARGRAPPRRRPAASSCSAAAAGAARRGSASSACRARAASATSASASRTAWGPPAGRGQPTAATLSAPAASSRRRRPS